MQKEKRAEIKQEVTNKSNYARQKEKNNKGSEREFLYMQSLYT